MAFEEEDKVCGKKGTQYEYAELEVVEVDNDSKMVLIEVTSHEYDPDQVGYQEWVGFEDIEPIGSTSPSYMKGGSIAPVKPVAPPSSQMETLLILGEI